LKHTSVLRNTKSSTIVSTGGSAALGANHACARKLDAKLKTSSAMGMDAGHEGDTESKLAREEEEGAWTARGRGKLARPRDSSAMAIRGRRQGERGDAPGDKKGAAEKIHRGGRREDQYARRYLFFRVERVRLEDKNSGYRKYYGR
jgi:hypothetical protein